MTVTNMVKPVTETSVCYRHPDKSASLRCSHNGCPHHICIKCAIQTPVGYKCPDCVKKIGPPPTGKLWDYPIAVGVALPLSLLTASLLTLATAAIGWFPWYIVLLVAPTIAGFIGEAVRWAVGKRRSPYLAHVVAGCFAASILPFLVAAVLASMLGGDVGGGVYGSALISLGILLVVGLGTIMARLG